MKIFILEHLFAQWFANALLRGNGSKKSDKKCFTREYSVNDVIVCKTFFLQTFRISSGKVDLALKVRKRPEGVKDLRGIGGGKTKFQNSI